MLEVWSRDAGAPPRRRRGEAPPNFQIALGGERGDMIAYAHCMSRTLISEAAVAALENRRAREHCECDLRSWDAACARWQADAAACWADLGVTGAAMDRAEVWRLRVLKKQRTLEPEEKARLKRLKAGLTPAEDRAIKEDVAAMAPEALRVRGQLLEWKEQGGKPKAVLDRLSDPTGKGEGKPISIKFECPFCGGEVRAGGPDATVLHEMPACDEFNRDEEPDVFLRRCREKMTS